jgi:hypothetical protein
MKTVIRSLSNKEIEEALARNTMRGYESTPEMRKQILENLEKLWIKHPSQRFGQLLENYVFGHHIGRTPCMFHVYDEITLENIKKALNE